MASCTLLSVCEDLSEQHLRVVTSINCSSIWKANVVCIHTNVCNLCNMSVKDVSYLPSGFGNFHIPCLANILDGKALGKKDKRNRTKKTRGNLKLPHARKKRRKRKRLDNVILNLQRLTYIVNVFLSLFFASWDGNHSLGQEY